MLEQFKRLLGRLEREMHQAIATQNGIRAWQDVSGDIPASEEMVER
jgi:hypothetical protein